MVNPSKRIRFKAQPYKIYNGTAKSQMRGIPEYLKRLKISDRLI